jgi:ribosome maturation factor RimP
MEKAQIFAKFEEIVSSAGCLLIDVNFRGDNRFRIIEVFIDNEKGITTDDCSSVSKALNETIQLENLVNSNYRLDVSSPGVERPLKYLLQYSKHINRKLEIDYTENAEIKKITGKLVRIEGEDFFLQEKQNEYKINFKNVIKAKVVISF